MATCNNTTLIYDSECVGDSLVKINNNFFNLDAGLCELGQDLLTLEAFVKSLTVKDSPTIDMSVSIAGYFLSADVVDNSLGTIKLGQDIPMSSKVFLTTTKLSSLVDTSINNPVSGELLLYGGNNLWINSSVEDKQGAKVLDELFDVDWVGPLQNNQILKYNASTKLWYNGIDSTELTVRNGNYGDIIVKSGTAGIHGPNGIGGPGTLWDLNQGVVGTRELAKDAVITEKIQDQAIVNDKIANRTIQLAKCAFDVGEINTGINIGSGTGIYVGQNDGSGRLPFKSLKGEGDVTITESNNTIVITVPPPPVIPPPPVQPPDEYYTVTYTDPVVITGQNLGSGEGKVYHETQSTPSNFKFRSIKGSSNVTVTESSTEVTITSPVLPVSLNLLGPITSSEIVQILNNVFPPSNYNGGTCKVIVQSPTISNPPSYTFSAPLTIKYYWNGNKNNQGDTFTLQEINGSTNITQSGDNYTATGTLNGTANPSSSTFTFSPGTPSTTIYSCNGSTWA
jgi:hypothetical protein